MPVQEQLPAVETLDVEAETGREVGKQTEIDLHVRVIRIGTLAPKAERKSDVVIRLVLGIDDDVTTRDCLTDHIVVDTCGSPAFVEPYDDRAVVHWRNPSPAGGKPVE